MTARFVRPDAVEVVPHGLVVRLTAETGRYGLVPAAEVLEFARVAVANAGPEALVYIGSGLSAHRKTAATGQATLPFGSDS